MQRGKNQTFEKTYEQCLEEFRILWEGFWQKLRNLEKSILFEIATRRTIDFKSPEIARLKDASLIYDAEKENYQPFSEEFCRFVQGKSTEVREESLILKNAKLLEEKTSLQEKIDRGKERESRQEALAIEAQQKVTATETIIIDKDEKIAAQDKRHKRDSLKIRLLLSVIFAIVSFSIIFLTPLLGKWTWFEQHPKKTNLYIIAVLFVCGISWIIIDTNLNRRLLIGGSLIIGLILTLLQIA
jgi:membrane-associated HD superfamily phosphohydrolase